MLNKEIVYAPIPDFDQKTQYAKQSDPVDMGDYIFVGFEVRGINQEDNTNPDMEVQP